MSIQRILVVTAVEAERVAVMRGLGEDMRFDVIAGGVGVAMAAASTTSAIMRESMKSGSTGYDLVVSAGIGGGFTERAMIGHLVVADLIVAADLGAETADGFCSVDELGFGSSSVAVDKELSSHYADALKQAGLSVVYGPLLTVTTVTGTAETALELSARVPGAVAEAMEGFGVATAARLLDVPVLELRAISNVVGPRDRGAWRIGEALDTLASASEILKEIIT